MIFDPFHLLTLFFGGALAGLIEGVIRKRGLIGIAINVVVGTVFGVATQFSLPVWYVVIIYFFPAMAEAKSAPAIVEVILYLLPIVGAMIGVMVVLKYIRRERWSTVGEFAVITVVFVISAYALQQLAISIFMKAYITESTYVRVTSGSPVTLDAKDMVRASGLTLAFVAPLTGEGTIATPNADAIAAAFPSEWVGKRYTFRIINRSDGDFNWVMSPGTGVTFTGPTAIPPNFWRNYEVLLGSPDSVFIHTKGTGHCDPPSEPSQCALLLVNSGR
jgi:hypothetical protein